MVEATREFLLGLFQYLRYMGFFLAETGKHESVEMALEMPSCFCVCATVLQVHSLCVLKNPPAGSIPGSGRSPGGGHSNPLQYFCLETPMDRGAWWATVHSVPKSWT